MNNTVQIEIDYIFHILTIYRDNPEILQAFCHLFAADEEIHDLISYHWNAATNNKQEART